MTLLQLVACLLRCLPKRLEVGEAEGSSDLAGADTWPGWLGWGRQSWHLLRLGLLEGGSRRWRCLQLGL